MGGVIVLDITSAHYIGGSYFLQRKYSHRTLCGSGAVLVTLGIGGTMAAVTQ